MNKLVNRTNSHEKVQWNPETAAGMFVALSNMGNMENDDCDLQGMYHICVPVYIRYELHLFQIQGSLLLKEKVVALQAFSKAFFFLFIILSL